MNGEKGQALPMAIIALAAGALVISPFLSHASSNLLSSRFYDDAISEQYAADSGVEHGIWSLTKGGLDEALVEPGDEITYQLGPLNGLTTNITVTANVTASGGTIGEIGDTAIDTLKFDTANGYTPDIIHVSGNIYAIAYRGTSNDGFLKTVSIATDGSIANSAIDTLEFDTANGYEPDIIHVSGNIYAIAYRGSGNDGFLKTFSIATDGSIASSAIDTLEFDTSNVYTPAIVPVSGSIFAVAYRGSGNKGYLTTVSIAANGDIANSVIDTLNFDTSNGYEPDIIQVSGSTYAIAYRSSGNDGFLKTVSINSNGDIGHWVIDTLEFDTSNGYTPAIIQVSGSVYAIAYRSSSNKGYLKTVSIAPSGDIANSVINTVVFDTSAGYEPSIIPVSGDVYAIAYRGSSNRGYLGTVSIAADGDIADTIIDTMMFNATGYEPCLIHISGDVYAIAYRGADNDGFVKTITINTQGGSPSADYEIVSSAGGSTIRAFINICSGNVTILSWLIE
jgi:hypothetical protein